MTATTKSLTVFGDPVDEPSLAQIKNVLDQPQAVKGALMADHHKGYSLPIGGVVAFDEAISPNGVGYDIACGNMAVRTNITLASLTGFEEAYVAIATIDVNREEMIRNAIEPIMREIQRKVEFGVGGETVQRVDHPVLDLGQDVWLDVINHFGADLHKKAVTQLGTVGGGNHYVDLLVDEHGYVWVANHFGSRGLGHTLASGFIAASHGLKFTERVSETDEPVIFSTKSDIGQFYLEAMQLAGRYAYAGREHVIGQVLEILGAQTTFGVHNHHNYAWEENGLIVVRKGATPLTHDYAFIGGSMGDDSYIVRGKTSVDEVAKELRDYGDDLYSTLYGKVVDLGNIGSAPHGAGRVMSRTQAAGKKRNFYGCPERESCGFTMTGYDYGFVKGDKPLCPEHDLPLEKFTEVQAGEIDWDATRASLTERGIVVLGAGADEAPGAYKRLDEVLAQHPNIEIAHRLSPIGVVMAGPDIRDPYGD